MNITTEERTTVIINQPNLTKPLSMTNNGEKKHNGQTYFCIDWKNTTTSTTKTENILSKHYRRQTYKTKPQSRMSDNSFMFHLLVVGCEYVHVHVRYFGGVFPRGG